jgi:hypothetical protein
MMNDLTEKNSQFTKGSQPSRFYKAIEEAEQYPIGTVSYFGPNDQEVTKISVVITLSTGSQISNEWHGENIAIDPSVAREIGKFLQANGVEQVLMTDGIVGCAHEEGVDYPQGENCPHCPYWQSQLEE